MSDDAPKSRRRLETELDHPPLSTTASSTPQAAALPQGAIKLRARILSFLPLELLESFGGRDESWAAAVMHPETWEYKFKVAAKGFAELHMTADAVSGRFTRRVSMYGWVPDVRMLHLVLEALRSTPMAFTNALMRLKAEWKTTSGLSEGLVAAALELFSEPEERLAATVVAWAWIGANEGRQPEANRLLVRQFSLVWPRLENRSKQVEWAAAVTLLSHQQDGVLFKGFAVPCASALQHLNSSGEKLTQGPVPSAVVAMLSCLWEGGFGTALLQGRHHTSSSERAPIQPRQLGSELSHRLPDDIIFAARELLGLTKVCLGCFGPSLTSLLESELGTEVVASITNMLP